jgi:hypothetical protein
LHRSFADSDHPDSHTQVSLRGFILILFIIFFLLLIYASWEAMNYGL